MRLKMVIVKCFNYYVKVLISTEILATIPVKSQITMVLKYIYTKCFFLCGGIRYELEQSKYQSK